MNYTVFKKYLKKTFSIFPYSYTYTYRNLSGRLREREIEVISSRDELINQKLICKTD